MDGNELRALKKSWIVCMDMRMCMCCYCRGERGRDCVVMMTFSAQAASRVQAWVWGRTADRQSLASELVILKITVPTSTS